MGLSRLFDEACELVWNQFIYVFIQQGCRGNKAQEVRCVHGTEGSLIFGRQILMPSLVWNDEMKILLYWVIFMECFSSSNDNARMGVGNAKYRERQGEKVVRDCD